MAVQYTGEPDARPHEVGSVAGAAVVPWRDAIAVAHVAVAPVAAGIAEVVAADGAARNSEDDAGNSAASIAVAVLAVARRRACYGQLPRLADVTAAARDVLPE